MTDLRWHSVGVEGLQKNWGWFVTLGVLLVLLGTVALGASVATTIGSVIFFGWLLIFGGLSESLHAFWRERGWGGVFVNLLTGILYVVVGFMMVANPAATAITLTLLIAMFLTFGGIFRIVVALIAQFPHRGWLALHGAINLMLGIAIWRRWPWDGLWVIGLFIGIDLLFNGWSLVMLGMTARQMPKIHSES